MLAQMVGDIEHLMFFCVQTSIPALSWVGDALVVTPAVKASLLGTQFDSKQSHQELVTPLSCFPQPVLSPFFWCVLFIAAKLSVIFGCAFVAGHSHVLALCKFTAIPKGTTSPDKRITIQCR